jgi:hypothetical protein
MSPNEVPKSAMNKTRESLTFEIRHFAAELRRLEERLKSEVAPDPVALNEFRHAVDNIRMTIHFYGRIPR